MDCMSKMRGWFELYLPHLALDPVQMCVAAQEQSSIGHRGRRFKRALELVGCPSLEVFAGEYNSCLAVAADVVDASVDFYG